MGTGLRGEQHQHRAVTDHPKRGAAQALPQLMAPLKQSADG